MPYLKVLSAAEINRYDYPPLFNAVQRKKYFYVSQPITAILYKRLRKPRTRLGFLLQWGYFQYTGRFFFPERFREPDIAFVASHLKVDINDGDDPLSSYYGSVVHEHQRMILRVGGYQAFKDKSDEFAYELQRLVAKRLRPKQIFFQIAQFLKAKRIELPTAYFLTQAITNQFRDFEQNLSDSLKAILSEQETSLLENLLTQLKSQYPVEQGPYILSVLKRLNQTTQPGRIKGSVQDFRQVKALFFQLLPVFDRLKVSVDLLHYHARWATKATTFQLQQLTDLYMQYLHLLSFIHHQFYLRQDNLMDIILVAVQRTHNETIKDQKEQYFGGRKNKNQAIREVTKSRQRYKEKWEQAKTIIQAEELADDEKIVLLSELIDDPLEDERLADQHASTLQKEVSPATQQREYFDILETKFRKINNRVGQLLQELTFDEASSEEFIYEAIRYYQQKKGQVGKRTPSGFLEKHERPVIETEEGSFRAALYKVLLFFAVARSIKAGTLNARYSYRYRAIDEYLIPKEPWHANWDQYIKQSGLTSFADGKTLLSEHATQLHDGYTRTNERIKAGENTEVYLNQSDNLVIRTPKVEKEDTDKLSDLFLSRKYVSILEVLYEVNQATHYLDRFEHYNLKYKKQRPAPEVFIAAIIGYGCNAGIRKISRISKGINVHTLETAVNWYMSLENIQAANQRIIETIDQLSLPTLFRKRPEEMHTSSDGQKFGIRTDSLNASHSFKYFGSGKGVAVYSFVDERSSLFHSTVINSSEREAAYVIDGLLNNEVVKSTIHSTDTHGYTEIVFGVAHLLGFKFAPRIKNVRDQTLYTLMSKSLYQDRDNLIQPNMPINEALILSQWDNVLRFVATIALRESTATQLFKRLSSYSRQHPLYKALKEYGRIIKTLFLLEYMDDVELRQAIEKQLNVVELTHRFSRAVFFGNNQEFEAETKDEQEVVAGCKQLIQNAIVLWNYLFLSEKLAKTTDLVERSEMLTAIQAGSIVNWQHINLQGEYDFAGKNLHQNANTFDLPKIFDFSL